MAKHTLANDTDKQQIVERLGKIQPNSSRRWGKMTPNQMLCHLADSFRVVIGEKVVDQLTEKLVPVTLPPRVIKWLALDVAMPWPKGVKTRREVDTQRDGTQPTDFTADMREVQRLLERFTRRPRDFEWRPHPMFGLMRDEDWLRWGYLHMDHHLRQFGA